MKTNIHDVVSVNPQIQVSKDGMGWLSLDLQRVGWFEGNKLETVGVTMFTDDIKTLISDLSESLREGLAQLEEEVQAAEA
jgi:hypothetical protein